MEREWVDPRDGTVWRVEAVAVMQPVQPGARVPMMDEVPWRLWFTTESASHLTLVDYETGSGLDSLTDADLRRLLDDARDVDKSRSD